MDTKDIAAFNLVGQTLNATWVVKQRIDKEPSGTGGFFSVCYLVEDRLHNNFFLKMVYCQSTTPPTLGENAFSNISREAKICVPKNSVALYKSANGWKDYASKIVGCDFK